MFICPVQYFQKFGHSSFGYISLSITIFLDGLRNLPFIHSVSDDLPLMLGRRMTSINYCAKEFVGINTSFEETIESVFSQKQEI